MLSKIAPDIGPLDIYPRVGTVAAVDTDPPVDRKRGTPVPLMWVFISLWENQLDFSIIALHCPRTT